MLTDSMSPTLQELIQLPEQQLGALLDSLSTEEALALMFDWTMWARPDQFPPSGDWFVWLNICGRGAGKTRSMLEFCRAEVESNRAKRVAFVAETAADARDVLIEGESGLLAISPPWFQPKYEPSKRRITWPNGAVGTTYSADDPEQLRGPQHDLAIADEVAKWRYEETWDNLMLGLRLGQSRCAAATTPRPKRWIRELMKAEGTVVSRGSTYDNMPNLSRTFIQKVITKYEGTRLGRQELHGELLEDNPGALWSYTLIELDRVRRDAVPDMARIVIGIDPAASSNKDSDETGIIVAGKGTDGHAYVFDDLSCLAKPAVWGNNAVSAYRAWKADRLVAEGNNGGEMVEHVVRTIDPNAPVELVRASRGKITRAEPVAALYEQHKVHHVGCFPQLEDQMCEYEQGSPDSPDRMDALVWALSELMLGGEVRILEAF